MSETFKQRVEHLEHEQTLPSPESHKAIAEHAEKIKQAEQAHTESLIDAREKVAELAKTEQASLEKEVFKSHEKDQDNFSGAINSELKAITFQREMKNIRRRLSSPERALSKAIHQPVIRITSEAAAKTITRPSGLLGGGVMALIGSTAYLYIAKNAGFTYNYSVFLILFASGFVLGLILELAIHSTRRSES